MKLCARVCLRLCVFVCRNADEIIAVKREKQARTVCLLRKTVGFRVGRVGYFI